MNRSELREFLDYKVLQFNIFDFIESDPVSVPHLFSLKEDIEISGFLTSTLAWGNRKAIIQAAVQLMERMDNSPFDFVMNAGETELEELQNYYYRTFRGCDLEYYITALRNICKMHHGLEHTFTTGYLQKGSVWDAISNARQVSFFTSTSRKNRKAFFITIKRFCLQKDQYVSSLDGSQRCFRN